MWLAQCPEKAMGWRLPDPECGWLGKREYSNLCDRGRVLVILEWEHFSFVCDVMILTRCDDSDEM